MNIIHKSSNKTSTYSMSKSSYSLNKSLSGHQISSPSTPNHWQPHGYQHSLQKSSSLSGLVESGRGFKPSDIKDPQKNAFLTNLTKKVFKVGKVSILTRDSRWRKTCVYLQ